MEREKVLNYKFNTDFTDSHQIELCLALIVAASPDFSSGI